jgi:thymidine kinase
MSLEIVLGPMFSGKTSYAISYIKRQKTIHKHILVIKPNIDNRYSLDSMIITHNKESHPCITWDVSQGFYPHSDLLMYDCIVIEEAQFFKNLESTVRFLLLKHHKHILLVGLDGDANQKPFGEILQCIPFSTKVIKLEAFCTVCKNGTPAQFTKKNEVDMSDEQIDIGGSDKYTAVCLKHL